MNWLYGLGVQTLTLQHLRKRIIMQLKLLSWTGYRLKIQHALSFLYLWTGFRLKIQLGIYILIHFLLHNR